MSHNLYEGSQNNPIISGYDYPDYVLGISGMFLIPDRITSPLSGYRPIVENSQKRKKVMLLRNDNKSLIRYEIDKEGPHIHYEMSGYKIKMWLPKGIPFDEFLRKVPKFKEKGNGLIETIKRISDFSCKKDKIKIMTICPYCMSQTEVTSSKICSVCGRYLE